MKVILHILLAFIMLPVNGLCQKNSAESQELPRIIILATGGTIAGQGQNPERAGYVPGKLPIQDILAATPSVHNIALVTGEQIASIGSYDMSIEIWLKLAKRINEIFNKNEADGIVITHGTDTQEETAYFLNLTVKSNKPVVLTGAMRPATAVSADGPKNLYDAIVVASDPKSVGRGVMVCFNENVYDAKTVVKMNTTNVNAFASRGTGPLGQIHDGKVTYHVQTLHKKTVETPFDVSNLKTLPLVDIAYMYVDAPETAITAFMNANTEGLIIAGSGNGSFNKAILKGVEAAIKKGIVVVRSSRVYSGHVTPNYHVFNDEKLGTIPSEGLNPQKARILLMLALTITKDRNRIQEMFLTY